MRYCASKIIKQHAQQGFQLIELVLVSLIISIMLALAVPDYAYLNERNAADTFATQFRNSISLARRYAKHLQVPMKLCPSQNQQTCQHEYNWASGYLIMTNPLLSDAKPKILQYIRGTPHIQVHKNGTQSQRRFFYISQAGLLQNASFSICDHANRKTLLHIISFYSGRVRFDREKNACF